MNVNGYSFTKMSKTTCSGYRASGRVRKTKMENRAEILPKSAGNSVKKQQQQPQQLVKNSAIFGR